MPHQTCRLRIILILATAAALIAPCSAMAIEYQWTGAENESWGNEANWIPVGVPGTGDDVLFDGSATRFSVEIGGNRTVAKLVFGAGADYWLLDSSTTSRLTIESGDIEAVGSGQSHQIDPRVTLESDADLNIDGVSISFESVVQAHDVTVNKFGSGRVIFNHDISVISGRLNIMEGAIESNYAGALKHADVFLASDATLTGSNVECIRFGGTGLVDLSESFTFYEPLADSPGFSGTLQGAFRLERAGFTDSAFYVFDADVSQFTGSMDLWKNNAILSDFGNNSAAEVRVWGGRTMASTDLPKVVVRSGGVLEPGAAQNAIGTITAESLAFSNEPPVNRGSLAIDVGGLTPGVEYDELLIDGNIDLTHGKLVVSYVNGFTANPGDTFTIMRGASITGSFANVTFPDSQPWYVDYDFGAGTVTLAFCGEGPDCDGDNVPDACELDTDNDGVPDDCDECEGADDNGPDTDGDGVVDACDVCLGDDATGDGDNDGVCDSDDRCQGADDFGIDADTDGIPDACDVCDGAADGDLNADHYIDLTDYADFGDCLTGPRAPMDAGCDCYDLDHDGRVTMADYAKFQLNFSGDALIEGPGEISLANMMIHASDKGFALRGEFADDLAGYSVALIGDVNSDGLGDLLVGAPSAGTGSDLQAGRAYIVYGSENFGGLNLSDIAAGIGGYAITGAFGNYDHDFPTKEIGHRLVVQDYYEEYGGPQGEGFGFDVNAAGDFNGDGVDDMLITAPYAPANGDLWGGRSYVLFGGQQPETGSPYRLNDLLLGGEGVIIEGEYGACSDCTNPDAPDDDGDLSGWEADGIRDFNGDGLADVLVSSPNFADNNRGRGYVIFGKTEANPVNLANFLNDDAGVLLDVLPPQGLTGFGARAIGMGDLNGDGLNEVGIAQTQFSRFSYLVNGRNSAGTASLAWNGPPTDIARINIGDFSYEFGEDEDGEDLCNCAVGRAAFDQPIGGRGDFNGDGLPDFVQAVRNYTLNEQEVLVFFDAPNGPMNLAALFGPDDAPFDMPLGGVRIHSSQWFMSGETELDLSGDLNGDGFDDLVMGVGGSAGRRTIVVFGRPGSQSIDLDTMVYGTDGLTIFDQFANTRVGFSVSAGGDFNGDGLSDLAIGAPYDDRMGQNAGAACVVYGDDFTSAITHRGDDGDDTLNGTSGADNFVGGRGNDTLIGDGGEDTLYAGAGDDRIVIGDNGFHRVRGGTGYDVLATTGGIDLNLSTARGRIDEIEEIDLTASGSDQLFAERIDVLNLSPTSNRVVVRASSEDQVTSLGESWRLEQIASIAPYGSVKQFNDGRAELWVSADAALRMSPVIATGALQIDESLTLGSVAGAIDFYDPDEDGIVSFTIVGGDGAGVFNLDAQTGELGVTAGLDFETANAYTLELEVVDGEGDVTVRTVEIVINNVNEAPVLTDQQFATSLPEHTPNGTEVGAFTATDEDDGDTIGFVIDYNDASLTSPAPQGSFAIDTNGVLTVADGSKLDYESLGVLEFIVHAIDASGLESDGAHVSIALTDVTEWTTPIGGWFVTTDASMWSTDGAQGLDPILWDLRFNLDSPDQGIDLFGHTIDAHVSGTVDLITTIGWDPGGVDASIPLAAALRVPDEIVLGQPITVQLDSGTPEDSIVLGGRTPSMIFEMEVDVTDFAIESTTYDVGPYTVTVYPSDRLTIGESQSWSADVADDRLAGTTSDKVNTLVDTDQVNWDSYLAQALSAAGLPSTTDSIEVDVFGIRVLTEYIAWTFNLHGSMRVEQGFSLAVEQFDATMVLENDDVVLLNFDAPTQITLPADADVNGDGRVDYEIHFDVDTLFGNDSQFFGKFGSTFDAGAFAYTAWQPGCSACGVEHASIGPIIQEDHEYDISLVDNTPGPWPNDEVGQFPLGGFNTVVVSGAFDLAN
ncbi:MAG: FG-GAP repeat protein [Phycisphaerales bacterium]|nr:FG-GAP repeat protein [Phycisphaerales bacterium]